MRRETRQDRGARRLREAARRGDFGRKLRPEGAAACALMLLATLGCGGLVPDEGAAARGSRPARAEPSPGGFALAAGLEQRAQLWSAAHLEAELGALGPDDLATLERVLEAARALDEAFREQLDPQHARWRAALVGMPGEEGRRARALFEREGGVHLFPLGPSGPRPSEPGAAQGASAPAKGLASGRAARPVPAALVDAPPPRPPGAGLYPPDLSADELRDYLLAHPDREAELLSRTTRVERRGSRLVGVPYSIAYGENLERAQRALIEAAALTEAPELAAALRECAAAIAIDQYRDAELALAGVDAPIELVLGPFDPRADRLLGRKTLFEALVAVEIPGGRAMEAEARRLLGPLLARLPGMDPGAEERLALERLRLVDLVYAGGAAAWGPLPLAWTRPHDAELRRLVGRERVLARNVARAKLDEVVAVSSDALLDPALAARLERREFERVLVAGQLARLAAASLLEAGADAAPAAERLPERARVYFEARAEAHALLSLLELSERGGVSAEASLDVVANALAWLLHAARVSPESGQGRGARLVLAHLAERRALVFRAAGADAEHAIERLALRPERLRPALRGLAGELGGLLAGGEREDAELLEARAAPHLEALDALLARTEGLPFGLDPTFALAEDAQRLAPLARARPAEARR